MLSLFIFAILLELYIDITNEIIVKIYIINAYNLYIVQSSDKSIVKKEGFFTWFFILIFNIFSNVWSHSYLFILLNFDKFYSLFSRIELVDVIFIANRKKYHNIIILFQIRV